MNITPTIHKRSNSTIDLIISLSPEQILEVLGREFKRPKLGRPYSLSAAVLDELFIDIDAGVSTAELVDRYKLSVSSINRLKRHRRRTQQEAQDVAE